MPTTGVDLRYKGSYGGAAAADFVRRIQDALRDLNQIAGSQLPPIMELSRFKRAIIDNPRCVAFLQNLNFKDSDTHFMQKIYVHQQACNSLEIPTSTTCSEVPSSNYAKYPHKDTSDP
ncbi:hypothetical protein N7517_009930 [Penicillium concentricum]|uniref:Uncharacterized protein n=1 Tax=Penicillium concentricum TaxID=293559 RepID=A0A9W9RKU2_9EURO|nr:uncharacterized protein N7517_009930 [Penicillium concentricum]KAJ5360739.1 hypothetical protein N7517_009930 [Penicillium concentricum]